MLGEGPWPKQFEIEKDLRGAIGFTNAWIRIEYDPGPLLPWQTLWLEDHEIEIVESVVVMSKAWRAIPEAGRRSRPEQPKEIKLSKNVSAFVEFHDAHVEIAIKVLGVTLPSKARIRASRIEKVEELIQEAKAWRRRPEAERAFLGAEVKT